jgi:hypothetical protein
MEVSIFLKLKIYRIFTTICEKPRGRKETVIRKGQRPKCLENVPLIGSNRVLLLQTFYFQSLGLNHKADICLLFVGSLPSELINRGSFFHVQLLKGLSEIILFLTISNAKLG